jgi:hypothetical protein
MKAEDSDKISVRIATILNDSWRSLPFWVANLADSNSYIATGLQLAAC